MAVHRWNAALDGEFSEAALRGKLEARGYRVARYVYSPGTVFPDHKHGVDKVDAVVSGRFRADHRRPRRDARPGRMGGRARRRHAQCRRRRRRAGRLARRGEGYAFGARLKRSQGTWRACRVAIHDGRSDRRELNPLGSLRRPFQQRVDAAGDHRCRGSRRVFRGTSGGGRFGRVVRRARRASRGHPHARPARRESQGQPAHRARQRDERSGRDRPGRRRAPHREDVRPRGRRGRAVAARSAPTPRSSRCRTASRRWTSCRGMSAASTWPAASPTSARSLPSPA